MMNEHEHVQQHKEVGTIEVAPQLEGAIIDATISAVVTRADGTVEDFGVISRMKKD